MEQLSILSYITVSFLAGFSTAMFVFIIGGYLMVKSGTSSKILNNVD